MMSTIRSKLSVVQGDITKLAVDVIVNAANRSLLGGGGVDGAIHDAAGPGLLEECEELDGCAVGEAKITGAHDIKQIKAIIHAVGPRVSGGLRNEHKQLLANCYINSLDLAKEHRLKSIAFPCISTGIYCFPNKEAAKVVLHTTTRWLNAEENSDTIDKVVFCVFNSKDKEIYDRLLSEKDDATTASDSDEPAAEDVSAIDAKEEATDEVKDETAADVKDETAADVNDETAADDKNETAADVKDETKADVENEIANDVKGKTTADSKVKAE